jgi:hypothetical protein
LWYQPPIITGRRVVVMTHRTNLNKINLSCQIHRWIILQV